MPTKVHPVRVTKEARKIFEGIINYNEKLHALLVKKAEHKNTLNQRRTNRQAGKASSRRSILELERNLRYVENKMKKSPKSGCFGGRKKCSTRVTPFSPF